MNQQLDPVLTTPIPSIDEIRQRLEYMKNEQRFLEQILRVALRRARWMEKNNPTMPALKHA